MGVAASAIAILMARLAVGEPSEPAQEPGAMRLELRPRQTIGTPIRHPDPAPSMADPEQVFVADSEPAVKAFATVDPFATP